MIKILGLNCLLTIVALTGAVTVAIAEEPGSEREVLTLGMNHVGLTVTDLDKSVAFFTETLDWKERD